MTSVGPPRAAPAPASRPGESRWSIWVWGTLFILCGALCLDALDASMIGIALPSIGKDLHLPASTLQWAVSGYVLGFGGFLLIGGRAADILGRRRVFLVSLSVFAFASLFGGLANDGALLIATRFIKGVAAAFTVPAGLSLLTTTFAEGPARNKALGIYAASGAAGFSLGLVVGGFLTEFGWRLTFLLPGPVALGIVVIAIRLIPKQPRDRPPRRHYDLAGAATITVSTILLVYLIVNAPETGAVNAATLCGLAITGLLLAAFVRIESRSPQPLVPLGMLRNRTLVTANLAGLLFFGSYVGFQFLCTLYMQTALGWSPLAAALALLPSSTVLPVLGPQTSTLIEHFGTPRLIAAALLSFAAGYALFLRAGANPTYVTVILPTMLLIGLGWGLGFPALTVQAMMGVGNHEQGIAAGLFNTSFQIGGALVVAIVSAVITTHTETAGSQAGGILDSIQPVAALVTVIAFVGAVLTLASTWKRPATLVP